MNKNRLLKKTRKIGTPFIALAFLVSQNTRAGAEEEHLLQTRTKILNQIAQLSILENYHKTYLDVRDHLLLGTTGIKSQAEEWNHSALSWLEAWKPVQALVELQREMNWGQLESVLNTNFKKQERDLRNLKDRAAAIEDKISTATLRLQKAEKPNIPLLTEGADKTVEPAIESVFNAVITFQYQLHTLSGVYHNRAMQLEALMEPSYSSVINKMGLAIIEPHMKNMETTLKKVEVLILMTKTVLPIIDQINEKAIHFARELDTRGYFHLELKYPEIHLLCTQLYEEWNRLQLPDSEFHPEYRRTQTTCNQIERDISTERNGDKKVLAIIYGNNKKQQYEADCSRASSHLNCDFYKIISSIDKEHIKKMSNAQLKNYELSWDYVESSDPTSVDSVK